MPTWLILLLIKLAIKFGSAWLLKKFPWLPKEVQDIIEWLLEQLKKPNVSNSVAKKKAIHNIKACYGIGCPIDLKKD